MWLWQRFDLKWTLKLFIVQIGSLHLLPHPIEIFDKINFKKMTRKITVNFTKFNVLFSRYSIASVVTWQIFSWLSSFLLLIVCLLFFFDSLLRYRFKFNLVTLMTQSTNLLSKNKIKDWKLQGCEQNYIQVSKFIYIIQSLNLFPVGSLKEFLPKEYVKSKNIEKKIKEVRYNNNQLNPE